MIILRLLAIVLVLAASFCLFIFPVKAATLNFVVDKDVVAIGDQFVAEARVDSEGIGINVAQATITFPKNLLEVVKLDKSDSVFNFWLQEPSYSNEEGTINFLGGSTNGINGQSLKILTVVFRAKAIGQADIAFIDATVTVSDGSGANALSGSKTASIAIGEERASGATVPVQISRAPEPAENRPAKPQISSPLYPDSAVWYNVAGDFLAKWALPPDVSEVAAIVDKIQTTEPAVSQGLFDHKEFLALSDGVWYLHVRFKNNVGWGQVGHYRIAIDRAPPKPFDITIDPGIITDNPAPFLQFKTTDALSGIKEYQVRIDNGDLLKVPLTGFKGSFKLPLQAPGKKTISITAIDMAGNSVESSAILEITAIESPIITFVSQELFSDEQKGLNIQGTSLPNVNVLLKIMRAGAVAAEEITQSNDKGDWEFTFDNPLRNGIYKVIAQSQDERGALSVLVESSEVLVKSKPIIQIGKLQLGIGGALIILLIVIAGGFIAGAWFYKKRQDMLALRVSVIKTDMAKIFKLIQDDIGKLQGAMQTVTPGDDEFMMKRLQENIKKMEGYLKKEVEKLK